MLWPPPYSDTLSDRRRTDRHRQIFFQHLQGLSEEEGEKQFLLVSGLVNWLEERRSLTGMTTLGISGTQGSGKSTLANQLALMLAENRFSALVLSLDDFYLSKQEREHLAEEVHPLLRTRGVPGTHDMHRMREVIGDLKKGISVTVPMFDKATDDRRSQDRVVSSPVEILIIEGWCLGAKPQSQQELQQPVNSLEREEDPNGVWRHYVNDKLAGDLYQQTFASLDLLLHLKVPEFQKVVDWRWRQEQQLEKSTKEGQKENQQKQQKGGIKRQAMNFQQIERFIMHYERITRHMLKHLPEDADVVFSLNDAHGVDHIALKQE